MRKDARFLWQGLALILTVAPYITPSVNAQSIFESGATNAMAAGVGAGAAASAGHGRILQSTYRSAAEAQQAALAEAKLMQSYMKQGCEYETKKQWANAEQCFKYCLQVSAHRDGPGSTRTIPTLEHLVKCKAAESEWGDAIGFQKRLVSFAKLDKVPDPARIIKTEIDLSNLMLQKQDFVSAETPLRSSYDLARSSGGVAVEKRRELYRTYAKVLRHLGKDDQADSVMAASQALIDEGAATSTVSSAAAPGAQTNSSPPTGATGETHVPDSQAQMNMPPDKSR